jgi:hypothetical protein
MADEWEQTAPRIIVKKRIGLLSKQRFIRYILKIVGPVGFEIIFA